MQVLMNGSVISYERQMWSVDSEECCHVRRNVHKGENTSVPPKKKLLDGCNPGNQSPGKYCTHFSLHALQTTIVGIVCLVVHDEFVVHKVETV